MPNPTSRPNSGLWGALTVLLVLVVVAAIMAFRGPTEPNAPIVVKKEVESGGAVVRVHQPVAVTANRTADAPDGFRGEVHPILDGRTHLDVTAHWTPLEKSQLKFEAPEFVRSWYTGLRPAVPQTTYTARDFSAFLPDSITDVGQVWAIDPDRIKPFLRQFHPNPSMHLVASGRRAGPGRTGRSPSCGRFRRPTWTSHSASTRSSSSRRTPGGVPLPLNAR